MEHCIIATMNEWHCVSKNVRRRANFELKRFAERECVGCGQHRVSAQRRHLTGGKLHFHAVERQDCQPRVFARGDETREPRYMVVSTWEGKKLENFHGVFSSGTLTHKMKPVIPSIFISKAVQFSVEGNLAQNGWKRTFIYPLFSPYFLFAFHTGKSHASGEAKSRAAFRHSTTRQNLLR